MEVRADTRVGVLQDGVATPHGVFVAAVMKVFMTVLQWLVTTNLATLGTTAETVCDEGHTAFDFNRLGFEPSRSV
jgi:hypothetical protein